MISESDLKIIKQISRKYHVKRVLLFGSSLLYDKESHDIDMAVEGIDDKDFFSFYGDLIFSLSKSIDLVEIKGSSKFIKLIERDGVTLYG